MNSSTESILSFLFKHWWKVQVHGLNHLTRTGPALIVGNNGGILPWAGLMLAYALQSHKSSRCKLNILADINWIEDKKIYNLACELGFTPWSATQAQKLFANGELVAIFPEGIHGAIKPFSQRYRLRDFDSTRILPALKERVPIYPLATLGCEESFPVIKNIENMAKFLNLPAFPITPFMPWLPFPLNLASFPVRWQMRILKKQEYNLEETSDDHPQAAQALSNAIEGEIQAELNRLLRARIKSIF